MSRVSQSRRGAAAAARGISLPGLHLALAVLIGMGFSILACGYVSGVCALFDATPGTFRWAAAIVVFAAALGPRLPRWIVRQVARLTRDRSVDLGTLLALSPSNYSRDVYWTATGIIGLAAGVAALTLPLLLHWAGRFNGWALAQFLWSGRALGVLDVLLMAATAWPFVLVGLFMHSAHRLPGGGRGWQAEVLVWMLGGMGLGFAITALLERISAGDRLMLAGGAIPLLVAAMIVVLRTTPRDQAQRPKLPAAPREPESSEHWRAVLRLAIAVLVTTTTSCALVWVYVTDALDMAGGTWRPLVGGVLVLFIAVGAGWSLRRSSGKPKRVGAFGTRCALAGVALAGGIAIFNLVTRTSYGGFVRGPGVWLLWGVGAGVPLAVVGSALGYGITALLARSGHESEAGAGLLQLMLISAGCACLAVALVLLEHLGSYATLVAMTLAQLAVGGTLLIHDPYSAPSAHRLRLGAVFGGVVGMTFLMPEAGRHWLGHQQRVPGRLWESWWVTHDLTSPRRDRSTTAAGKGYAQVDQLVEWYRVRPGSRVGLISLFGDLQVGLPASFKGQIEQWPLLDGAEADAAAGSTSSWSALRALRARPGRFDVLLISLETAPVEFAQRVLDDGLIARAWSRLSRDGVLLCILPGIPELAETACGALRPELARDGGGVPACMAVPVAVAGRGCALVVAGGSGVPDAQLPEWVTAGADSAAADSAAAGPDRSPSGWVADATR